MFRHFTHPPHRPEAESAGRGCHIREHARFGGGRHEHFERGFGAPRERLFDSGDLQLIILHLLSEKPSYGYELIKAIEERMAGGYAPSPGVVYPTLTLLEERGFARVEPSEGSRKVYAITDEGRQELQTNAARVQEVTARVDRSGQRFRRGKAPEIMRAFQELRRAVLRAAVRGRASGEGVSVDQIARITQAIEQAAHTIDTI